MFSDTIALFQQLSVKAALRLFASAGRTPFRKWSVYSKVKQVNTSGFPYRSLRSYCGSKTGENLEEVLVTVMRAPRSFTTEDVVEISAHGGVISVKRVMDLLLQLNIRLAEPGEFTKRAFLNGRIDLSQAEAVMDLIRSKSDRAFSVALKQVEGTLSRKINESRHTLVETLAHIEVNIDYPEHDVESLTSEFIKEKSQLVMGEIDKSLKTAQEGKILREGITTAIIGRPNVGKSSLLNTLAQDNRAIVTDIPGTTRDVIEEFVTINNIPLKSLIPRVSGKRWMWSSRSALNDPSMRLTKRISFCSC